MVVGACGDDDGGGDTTTTGDGDGTFDNASLEVLEPDEGAVGLTFGESGTLAVRYRDSGGDPIADATVNFDFLVGTGENTGGSTLSATSAVTDDDGVASIGVVAGAQSVNFRVTASAESASPATFFVAVSDQGFITFDVALDYRGQRDDLASLELRMYLRDQVRCADIDLRAPPGTVFPRRSAGADDPTIEVPLVIALRAYTVVVIASAERDGAPLAGGCVGLGADQVLVGRPVQLGISIEDLPLALPTVGLPLVTSLDTTAAAALVRERGAEQPWDVLACPAGPGQLLLDCAIDALAISEGDPSDCRVVTTTPDIEALQAARGALGPDGCRAAQGDGGGPSLDQQLTAAVAAGGSFPTGSALASLLGARQDVLAGASLRSRIAGDGGGRARHTLSEVAFATADQTATVDLTASPRPVIEARQVPLVLTLETATVGEHGFSLRLGSAQATAFDALALAPAGLAGQLPSLGTALLTSVQGPTEMSCGGVSELACEAAALGSDCLAAACPAGALAADAELAAWPPVLDGSALDLTLAGSAPVGDAEPNLEVDALGGSAGERLGTWDAALTTDQDQVVEIDAAFGTEP